jgi:hypothetical protein
MMDQPKDEQRTAWNPEVLENRIFMLLPLTFDSESMLDVEASQRLNDFVNQVKSISSNAFPGTLEPFFPHMGVSENQKLWVDLPGDATQDFHPFVRQIASVPKNGNAGKQPFSRPLRLAEERLVSQLKGGKPRRFSLALGQAAATRCGRDSIALQLHAPSIYAFASGTAMVVLEWSYLSLSDDLPLRALDVLEGNYALSHPVRGKSKEAPPLVNCTPIDPETLVKYGVSLLPANLASQIRSDRRFLYTGLRIPSDALDTQEMEVALFARRLARRETSDYQPNPKQLSVGQLCPFSNVRHVAAIEGGCTVVEAAKSSPEFLQTLLRDRVRNTYLPLAMVSIHSYFWLLNMTQTLPDSSRTPDAYLEKKNLESLQEKLLNFRRVFHFPIASQISQHNEFHDLWQSQLQINRQLISLAELSASAASMVQEKRVKLIGYLSGGAGGLILGKEILEMVSNKLSMNTYEWQNKLLTAITNPNAPLTEEIQNAVHRAEFMEWFVFLGALFCGVAGVWIASRFDLNGRHE